MAPKRPKSYDPEYDVLPGDDIWVDDPNEDPYCGPGESDEYYADSDDDLYSNINYAARSSESESRMGNKEKRRRANMIKGLGLKVPKRFQTVDAEPNVVKHDSEWKMPQTLSPNEVAALTPVGKRKQSKLTGELQRLIANITNSRR